MAVLVSTTTRTLGPCGSDLSVDEGYYRSTKDGAIHYVDPKTGLNVFTRPNGELWSGFKLSKEQLDSLSKTGGFK
jgi:hypothetical protein